VQGYDAGMIVVVLWEHLQWCCDLAVRAVAVQKESERGTVTDASKLKHDSSIEI
jgi:hypothetical protein